MALKGELQIGDHVIPSNDLSHRVMTVYELTNSYRTARLNWLIGTRMFFLDYPVALLRKVPRRRHDKT